MPSRLGNEGFALSPKRRKPATAPAVMAGLAERTAKIQHFPRKCKCPRKTCNYAGGGATGRISGNVCYNILSSKDLTCGATPPIYPFSRYAGKVIIPETVTYGEKL